MLLSSNHFLNDSQPRSVAYLDKFNPEQRRGVENGVRGVIETRAEIYEKLGQRDKAIADYRQSLTLNPDMKSAQNGLTRLGAY